MRCNLVLHQGINVRHLADGTDTLKREEDEDQKDSRKPVTQALGVGGRLEEGRADENCNEHGHKVLPRAQPESPLRIADGQHRHLPQEPRSFAQSDHLLHADTWFSLLGSVHSSRDDTDALRGSPAMLALEGVAIGDKLDDEVKDTASEHLDIWHLPTQLHQAIHRRCMSFGDACTQGQTAPVEDHHIREQRGEVWPRLVHRHHHRDLQRDLLQHAPQDDGRLAVEACRGFVQQQHVRTSSELNINVHQPALTSGQCTNARVQLVRQRAHVWEGAAAHGGREGDGLGDGVASAADRILRHKSHRSAQLRCRDLVAVQKQIALSLIPTPSKNFQ
mmetsp:Transcript_101027/g.324423  ORF Transcript_101027/g.324423 Transcript_101027/m.324423 type:complete len:333 (+) Transcript_101027:2849-3847(+)